jgi:serine/threonine protein kinase
MDNSNLQQGDGREPRDSVSFQSLSDAEVAWLQELYHKYEALNKAGLNSAGAIEVLKSQLPDNQKHLEKVWGHAIKLGYLQSDAKFQVLIDWLDAWNSWITAKPPRYRADDPRHARRRARERKTVRVQRFRRVCGRFIVKRVLGSGGFGVVVEAVDTHFKPDGRSVALKVPRVSDAAVPESGDSVVTAARERFRFFSEVKSQGHVNVPGCVAIHDSSLPDKLDIDALLLFLRNNPIWFSMQCIDGKSLADVLHSTPGGYRRGETISDERIVTIMAKIAECLRGLHGTPSRDGEGFIVHKDLKPANILLDQQGNVWVTDFGLASGRFAQRVRDNPFSGTMHYAAPEQFNGFEANEQSDIWAWGVVFYEMLTGQLPFSDQERICDPQSPISMLRAARSELPAYLEKIVQKCLDRDRTPGRRYGSFIEVIDDLRRADDGLGRIEHEFRQILDRVEFKVDDVLRGMPVRDPRIVDQGIHSFLAEYLGSKQHRVPFGGRGDDLAQLDDWLDQPSGSPFRLLVGRLGAGKSALLTRWYKRVHQRSDVAVIFFPVSIKYDTNDARSCLAAIASQVAALHGDGKSSGLDISREMLSDYLCRALPDGRKLLVILDGLDEAFDWTTDAILAPIDPPSSLRILVSARTYPDDPEGKQWQRNLGWDRRSTLNRVQSIDSLSETGLADVLLQMGMPLAHLSTKVNVVAQLYRLTEKGDPLLTRLYVDKLCSVEADRLQPEDLADIEPGYGGYIQGWWRDQQKLWSQRQSDISDPVQQVLNVLACAHGPLRSEDLHELLGETLRGSWIKLDEVLSLLSRFIIGKGQSQGYSFGHPKLAEYFSQNLVATSPREWREVNARFLAWGERALADLQHEISSAAEMPPYLVRYLAMHLDCAASHAISDSNHTIRIRDRLVAQGRYGDTSLARMTIQCLIALARHDPNGVAAVILDFVEESASRLGGVAMTLANIQAARIALEVALATRQLPAMACAAQRVILAACDASDSNVRSLAIVTVFRLVREGDAPGASILTELSRRSVRFGFPQPRRLGVFIGCTLGLFFEKPHDTKLRAQLRDNLRRVLFRMKWLRVALYLTPPVAATLLTSLPDHIPVNLAELRAYKKYIVTHRDLLEIVNKMIAFLDPAHGTSEQFTQVLNRLEAEPWPIDAFMAYCSSSAAWVSRALAGDESVLDTVYEVRKKKPPGHYLHQDFIYWMRIVQIGRVCQGKPPLDDQWTTRIEEMIREFFYNQHAVVRGNCRAYVLAGMIGGIVFLANQPGNSGLRLLKELIEWALGNGDPRQWPDTPDDFQPIALLMRLLESVGVEAGLCNPLARRNAFFGIRCFLENDTFSELHLLDRLAVILVRMRVYNPLEVDEFLTTLRKQCGVAVDELEVRISTKLPQEGVGVLLSNFDLLYGSILAEPVDGTNGLRGEWISFLYLLLGSKGVRTTLHCGVQQLARMVQSGPKAPSTASSE